MDGDYIQLRWNCHHDIFCNNLSSLRDKQVFTDVTLSCEGHFYPAHRLVLLQCSTYFAQALQVVNASSPVILLHGIRQDILEALLTFIYDGVVTLSQVDVRDFVEAGTWLGIKQLDCLPKSDITHNRTDGRRCIFPNAVTQTVKDTQIAVAENPLNRRTGDQGDRASVCTFGDSPLKVGGRENEVSNGDVAAEVEESLIKEEPAFVQDVSDSAGNLSVGTQDVVIEEDITSTHNEGHSSKTVGLNSREKPSSSGLEEYKTFNTNMVTQSRHAITTVKRKRKKRRRVGIPGKPSLRNSNARFTFKGWDNNGMEAITCSESPEKEHQEEIAPEVKKSTGRKLRCKHCRLMLTDQISFVAHLRTHTNMATFTCSTCAMKFSSLQDLEIHSSAVYPFQGRHKCQYCCFTTKHHKGLLRHMHVHLEKTVKKLDIKTKAGLSQFGNRHTNRMLRLKVMKMLTEDNVETCGEKIDTLSEATNYVPEKKKRGRPRKINRETPHVKSEELVYKMSEDDIGIRNYANSKENKTLFKASSSIVNEAARSISEAAAAESKDLSQEHSERNVLVADQKADVSKGISCLNTSADPSGKDISTGVEEIHEDSPVLNLVNVKVCRICDRHFKTFKQMLQHKNFDCKVLECQFCGKTYPHSERDSLSEHLLDHRLESAPFHCTQCDYVSRSRRSLVDHISLHTGVYRFSCQLCKFKCHRQYVLDSHVDSEHPAGCNQ